MAIATQLDLKMGADDEAHVAKAAASLGTTMVALVRLAAIEKAQIVLERDAKITLVQREFRIFARGLNSAIAPNPVLKGALKQARRRVRRA